MKKIIFTILLLTSFSLTVFGQAKLGDYKAKKASNPIIVDGKGNEADWKKAEWKPVDQVWVGEAPSKEDYSGRYKLLWDDNLLYFLVEIHDDSLSDQVKSPFEKWWEDDCLELFIDEDDSDGNHQLNHTAFAYHITLDYDVVDLGPDDKPILFNDHLTAKWTKTGTSDYTWEVAMRVFDKNFDQTRTANQSVKLTKGKKMGFAVSYNDNDGNNKRENMIGSMFIEGEDKNRGWIDAGVFGTVELVE